MGGRPRRAGVPPPSPSPPPLQSINGIVNKVNAANLRHVLPELFSENLVRGRGLLARTLLKSQLASPSYAPVLAALVAVVNTKLPEVGELVLARSVATLKRAYARSDRAAAAAAASFVAHLANQQVADPLLVLQLLALLLETPTGDSIDIAVAVARDAGALLADVAPRAEAVAFDRFRAVLAEGAVDRRAQFRIEALFRERRTGYDGRPPVPPSLDLVDAADQITHPLGLDDELETDPAADAFSVDPDFGAKEAEWAAVKREILGDGESESGSGSGSESGSESEGGDGGAARAPPPPPAHAAAGPVTDATETDLVNLRRTIYLTIMSALDFEEAGHKLAKIALAPGQEVEVVTMVLECASQEKTYLRFYGLLAARFCALRRVWADLFEACFQKQVGSRGRRRARSVAPSPSPKPSPCTPSPLPSVRPHPPAGDQQAAQRGEAVRPPLCGRRDFLVGPLVRPPHRGRHDLLRPHLCQGPVSRLGRGDGAGRAAGAVAGAGPRARARRPLSGRRRAQPALRHQLFHVVRPGRAHRGRARAPGRAAGAAGGAESGRGGAARGQGVAVVVIVVRFRFLFFIVVVLLVVGLGFVLFFVLGVGPVAVAAARARRRARALPLPLPAAPPVTVAVARPQAVPVAVAAARRPLAARPLVARTRQAAHGRVAAARAHSGSGGGVRGRKRKRGGGRVAGRGERAAGVCAAPTAFRPPQPPSGVSNHRCDAATEAPAPHQQPQEKKHGSNPLLFSFPFLSRDPLTPSAASTPACAGAALAA